MHGRPRRALLNCFLMTSHCFFIVSEAVSIIKDSKKPIILLGSQATLPPVSADKLRESLEVCFEFQHMNVAFNATHDFLMCINFMFNTHLKLQLKIAFESSKRSS